MRFTAKITLRTNVAPEHEPHTLERFQKARWKTVTLATLHGFEKQDVEEAARIWLRNNSWFWDNKETRIMAEDLITIDISYKELTGMGDIMSRDPRNLKI